MRVTKSWLNIFEIRTVVSVLHHMLSRQQHSSLALTPRRLEENIAYICRDRNHGLPHMPPSGSLKSPADLLVTNQPTYLPTKHKQTYSLRLSLTPITDRLIAAGCSNPSSCRHLGNMIISIIVCFAPRRGISERGFLRILMDPESVLPFLESGDRGFG